MYFLIKYFNTDQTAIQISSDFGIIKKIFLLILGHCGGKNYRTLTGKNGSRMAGDKILEAIVSIFDQNCFTYRFLSLNHSGGVVDTFKYIFFEILFLNKNILLKSFLYLNFGPLVNMFSCIEETRLSS